MRLLSVPLLFIAPGADPASRKAREQFQRVGTAVDVRYLEYPGAHHDFLARDLRAYDLASSEAAWRGVASFLKERLLPPPPKPPAPPVRTTAPPPPAAGAPAKPPTPAASAAPAPVARP